MGQAMMACRKAQGILGHVVPWSVDHALQHVGGVAGRVRLEGEVDEVVHRVDEQFGLIDGGLQ